jgi:hypothetical protein
MTGLIATFAPAVIVAVLILVVARIVDWICTGRCFGGKEGEDGE